MQQNGKSQLGNSGCSLNVFTFILNQLLAKIVFSIMCYNSKYKNTVYSTKYESTYYCT